jgi:hypothetical protein
MFELCEEVPLVCRECASRFVSIRQRRDGMVVVYADLEPALYETAMFRRVVEKHVARCAEELAATLCKKAVPVRWFMVNGKMRFFYVVT